MRIWQFIPRWFNAPDIASILADGSIAGELAAASNVVNSHFKPFGLILGEEEGFSFDSFIAQSILAYLISSRDGVLFLHVVIEVGES